jgi:hypothetical protein
MTESQALVFTVALFATALLMAARLGRWHLLQVAVFALVSCAGIYWSIGGYAASVIAGLAAYFVTIIVARVVQAFAAQ